jgi:undecaprenyl-diphosphatase
MVDFLLNLADPWGYVVVALLVAGEAAIFVGLVLPGETAAFLGGVLAFQGSVDLWTMIVWACVAAIVGDSIGYRVGQVLGPRMRQGRLGRWVGEERWERAASFLRRYGGRAVFLGRWVGVLRALVPSLSGAAGIRYPVFFAFNVLGGVTWATSFILLGYLAGRSWRTVENLMGQATIVIVALLAFIAAAVLGARWASSHRDEIARRRDEFLERPRIASFRRRFRAQLDFVHARLDPGHRFGFYLTLGVVFAVAGGWVFGAVLEDVLQGSELVLVDRPITVWLMLHRDGGLTGAMKVLTVFGSTPFVAGVGGAAAIFLWLWTRSLRWPAFFALAVAGGLFLDVAIAGLVARPRPELDPLVTAGGYAFPSGYTTAATVLFGSLAYFTARGRSWGMSVWIWTAAVTMAVLVGFSRIYLGVSWFSDVLGGFFLGAFWTVVSIMATALLGKDPEGSWQSWRRLRGNEEAPCIDVDEPREAEVS